MTLKPQSLEKMLVMLFFALLIGIGAIAFNDYGISWDEPFNIGFGGYEVKFISAFLKGRPIQPDDLMYDHARTHGPLFEMFLFAFTQKTARATFFTRHFINFLSFILGVFFFYKLAVRLLGSRRYALAGCLALVLSPRIFSHAFYNSLDIPFMAFFTLSMVTLLKFLDRPTAGLALLHALACALLINIRPVGIYVPVLTGILAAKDIWLCRADRAAVKKSGIAIAVFLTACAAAMFLTLPFLWTDPLHHIAEMYRASNKVSWRGETLYMGKMLKAANLPWHYNFVWIAITTPPLYIALFFIACGRALYLMLRDPGKSFTSNPGLILFSWCFVPLLLPLILRSKLYDSWRHHFFIYPAFLLLALYGARALASLVSAKFTGPGRRYVFCGFAALIAAAYLHTARTMVKLHPYEHVYFNFLAGDRAKIRNQFELDYWGLSYREGLEAIFQHDASPKIPVRIENFPGFANMMILDDAQKARIKLEQNMAKAKYLITNFRGRPGGYDPSKEVFSVKRDGMKILAVYKLR